MLSALLAMVVPAGAGIVTEAKVLFSPTLSSVGMTVTQSGSDPNKYFLTFLPQRIDAAVLNGAQVVGDPSEGWDVIFGPLVVDASSRTVVGGIVYYDILSAPGYTTLTVMDGATTRLSATLTPLSKLATFVNWTFGGLDTQAADLTGLVFDLTGLPLSGHVFAEFAKRTNLDFGFAYTGLDLDKILKNRLAGGLARARRVTFNCRSRRRWPLWAWAAWPPPGAGNGIIPSVRSANSRRARGGRFREEPVNGP